MVGKIEINQFSLKGNLAELINNTIVIIKIYKVNYIKEKKK
jgi:hypothetical protein